MLPLFKTLVERAVGSLKGVPRLLSLLRDNAALKIRFVAHFRFEVDLLDMPLAVVDEELRGSVDAAGNASFEGGVPHFSLDNGSIPSLANAAAQLVKVVIAQQSPFQDASMVLADVAVPPIKTVEPVTIVKTEPAPENGVGGVPWSPDQGVETSVTDS